MTVHHPDPVAAPFPTPPARRRASPDTADPEVTDTGRDADAAAYCRSENCLDEGLDALEQPAWGTVPPPWAPGRREEAAHVERIAAGYDRTYCLSEVDIFTDLS